MLEEKQKAYVKNSLARAISEMKVAKIEGRKLQCVDYFINEMAPNYPQINISENIHAELSAKSDHEVAVWYNDNVIYPDKVRLNCLYYRHYSFWKDIEMIFATVLGFKVKFAGEEV